MDREELRTKLAKGLVTTEYFLREVAKKVETTRQRVSELFDMPLKDETIHQAVVELFAGFVPCTAEVLSGYLKALDSILTLAASGNVVPAAPQQPEMNEETPPHPTPPYSIQQILDIVKLNSALFLARIHFSNRAPEVLVMHKAQTIEDLRLTLVEATGECKILTRGGFKHLPSKSKFNDIVVNGDLYAYFLHNSSGPSEVVELIYLTDEEIEIEKGLIKPQWENQNE